MNTFAGLLVLILLVLIGAVAWCFRDILIVAAELAAIKELQRRFNPDGDNDES